MVAARAPLRITLGGGGTDAREYARVHGGLSLVAAIDHHVWVAVGDEPLSHGHGGVRFRPVTDNALARAVLDETGTPGLRVWSAADVPSGSGLGSSAAFTVAMLNAVTAHMGGRADQAALADRAYRIEADVVGRPTGPQDAYATALGGFKRLEFFAGGRVEATPLAIGEQAADVLAGRLLLFHTGQTRDSSALLLDQRVRTVSGDEAMTANLHEIKSLGRESGAALESGDFDGFGDLLDMHWKIKKARSQGMTDPAVDRWYQLAINAGATGGKIIGAGGGGCLFFYARDPGPVRTALSAAGLHEIPFTFDRLGTTVR